MIMVAKHGSKNICGTEHYRIIEMNCAPISTTLMH
jgi:hypothetical protein